MATYSKEDKAMIKKLKAAEIDLTGEESSDEIKTLSDQLDLNSIEPGTEQEEIDGVPNILPIRTEEIEVGGKVHQLPVFFVATVKGGKMALYSYTGQRTSPAYGPEDPYDASPLSPRGVQYIAKAAAKFNAMRRKNIIPGETQIG